MRKIIFVDYSKCVGCRICELVCSFHHFKKFNPTLSGIRLVKYDHISRDIPLVCEQCEDAPCKFTCPTNSIHFNSNIGAYEINRKTCIGCKRCVLSCPFGAISFDVEYKAIKCDLCSGEPQCLKICPSEALSFEELSCALTDKKYKYLNQLLSKTG